MKKKFLEIIFFIVPMIFFHGAYAIEGMDLDMAVLKINKEVKSLNNQILSLKDEIELIKEGQRLSSLKISELLKIIELNRPNDKNLDKSNKIIQDKSSNKLYSDGKNEFTLGNYERAINLFINYAKDSPNALNIKNSKLWLARAYSANEQYLKSKNAFLDYQFNNEEHSKYANSMFELSKVLVKLSEINEAKLLLLDMIKKYPNHSLVNKAKQLLLDF